jgi:hypothetical protein
MNGDANCGYLTISVRKAEYHAAWNSISRVSPRPEVRSWSFASTLGLAKAAAQAQRNFDIHGV